MKICRPCALQGDYVCSDRSDMFKFELMTFLCLLCGDDISIFSTFPSTFAGSLSTFDLDIYRLLNQICVKKPGRRSLIYEHKWLIILQET
jgi:hypothetical protein